jgi:precorrin-3B C17-methyltransferase
MNPWEKIEKRLVAAASGDFVTCLYNPRSTNRVQQIEKAREIFLAYRSPETPVAIIRNAFRDDQSKVITALDAMLSHEIDMLSIVIIGCSESVADERWMLTKRGYK